MLFTPPAPVRGAVGDRPPIDVSVVPTAARGRAWGSRPVRLASDQIRLPAPQLDVPAVLAHPGGHLRRHLVRPEPVDEAGNRADDRDGDPTVDPPPPAQRGTAPPGPPAPFGTDSVMPWEYPGSARPPPRARWRAAGPAGRAAGRWWCWCRVRRRHRSACGRRRRRGPVGRRRVRRAGRGLRRGRVSAGSMSPWTITPPMPSMVSPAFSGRLARRRPRAATSGGGRCSVEDPLGID